MAEKKPAAKKPAAKRTAKPKQAVPDVVDNILTSPGERAGRAPTVTPFQPLVAEPRGTTAPGASPLAAKRAQNANVRNILTGGKVDYAAKAAAIRAEADKKDPQAQSRAAATAAADKKRRANAKKNAVAPDMAKTISAGKAEEEAARVADRVRKGASATVDAPAPRKFSTGRVAKASAVKKTTAKRTPSARKVQRAAQAATAAAALQPVEKTASDYLGAAPRQVKEIVPVWHSPASDLLTRFSNTPHIRTMKLVNSIDAKIGYNGENLPSSISPEVRQEVSARMASVKESHNRAYHAAITGDPVASLQRASEAHETLASIGHILSQDPEANKTRALSVARDIVAPIKQHGDIVKRALSDQKKNMSIETTDPQWKTADSVMGLRNEKTTAKEGPYSGLRPAKDFRTPDTRNSNRGNAIFPTIKTLVTTAMNHSVDPRDQMHAEKLLQTARGFGGAVAAGDRTAAVSLGQQTLLHLSALHNSVRNQLNTRYPAGQLGSQVVNLYANTLAQHHDHAAFRIKEILGEK